MDEETTLSRLVQVGTVSAVDNEKRMARVMFRDTGIDSWWLYVLQHYEADVTVKPDAEHTHAISDTFTGGGSAGTYPAHLHPGTTLAYWMPKVNDRVLVLYLPVFNADGFILGGI